MRRDHWGSAFRIGLPSSECHRGWSSALDLIHGALGWRLQILQQFCRIVDSFVRGHATAFGQRFRDGLFSKCMAR